MKCWNVVLVVYATLVTLDGSQNGSNEPQIVVPADGLNGQEIDLAALAGLTSHGSITADDLQVRLW